MGRTLLWTSGALLLAFLTCFSLAWRSVRDLDLSKPRYRSIRVLDREGRALRSIPLERRLRAEWAEVGEIPPLFLELTILAEDRRFRVHPGVDPLAILRALGQNLRAGRVVSGASTLTEQSLRMLRPRRYPRRDRWSGKLWELFEALALDRMWSKEQQLLFYLNSAPYGNSSRGVVEAARAYYRKSPRDLTPLEIASLVVATRNPNRLNPSRGDAARPRALALLARAQAAGLLSEDEVLLAGTERASSDVPSYGLLAMHASEQVRAWLLEGMSADRAPVAEVKTSIDRALQARLEPILARHLGQLARERDANGALLVLDAKSAEVLAYLGSMDYFDRDSLGANDGVISPRQPGSTLKPFLYGLALEDGLTLASPLADIPLDVHTKDGSYEPANYSGHFAGPVRARLALANSLNVPAVRLLQRVGVDRFFQRLHALGLTSLDKDPEHYGLGLALGNGEVPLLDLAAAYASLANGGLWRAPRLVLATSATDGTVSLESEPQGRRVFSPRHAALISDVLSDAQARTIEFGSHSPITLPFKVAVKTGTSSDYRDALAIGYTPDLVVAVWVGHFAREGLAQTPGAVAAGPILRDVFYALYPEQDVSWVASEDAAGALASARICTLSGDLATALCPLATMEIFDPAAIPESPCRWHRRAGPGEVSAVNVVLPREYHSWALAAGHDVAPRRPTGEHPSGRVVIHAPSDGAVYFIPPSVAGESPSLPGAAPEPSERLLGRASASDGSRLRWIYDGQFVGDTASGAGMPLALTPGEHQLRVEAIGPHKGQGSARLRFHVR